LRIVQEGCHVSENPARYLPVRLLAPANAKNLFPASERHYDMSADFGFVGHF
jgi:hypothetical protein